MQNPRLSANTISIIFPYVIHVYGHVYKHVYKHVYGHAYGHSMVNNSHAAFKIKTLRSRLYLVKIRRFAVTARNDSGTIWQIVPPMQLRSDINFQEIP